MIFGWLRSFRTWHSFWAARRSSRDICSTGISFRMTKAPSLRLRHRWTILTGEENEEKLVFVYFVSKIIQYGVIGISYLVCQFYWALFLDLFFYNFEKRKYVKKSWSISWINGIKRLVSFALPIYLYLSYNAVDNQEDYTRTFSITIRYYCCITFNCCAIF